MAVIEESGDLWKIGAQADAIVVTTNGSRRWNGENIMGGGCAKEAALLYPWLPAALGARLAEGNNVYLFPVEERKNWPGERQTSKWIVTMPTKNDVRNGSEIKLVEQSTKQLVTHADVEGWKHVVMPRPGCGLGGLSWDEVKPLIEPLLDDRFTVVHYG